MDSRVLLSLPTTLVLLPGIDDEEGLGVIRNSGVEGGSGCWFPEEFVAEGRCSQGVLDSIGRLDGRGFDDSKGAAASGGLPEVFGEVRVECPDSKAGGLQAGGSPSGPSVAAGAEATTWAGQYVGEGLGIHPYGGRESHGTHGLKLATRRKYRLVGAVVHVDEAWNRRGGPEQDESADDGTAPAPAGVRKTSEAEHSSGHYAVLARVDQRHASLVAPDDAGLAHLRDSDAKSQWFSLAPGRIGRLNGFKSVQDILNHAAVTPCTMLYASCTLQDEAPDCRAFFPLFDLSGPQAASLAVLQKAWVSVAPGSAVSAVPLRVFSWGVELS